ncbi:hypothetical protein [Phycicoccus sp.]|uniref:hypothetical protein n=1 Tax=Phycicoccus sp. TaxID=1902410 RepID=UPI002C483C7A|nr:hypothetical protein [Phycicoccus sp.]HMM97215.1 hypothetical protein [Phycicoccus sp.]
MKRSILTALALSGALVLGACGSATNDTATGGSTSQEQKAPDVKVGDLVDLKTLATKTSAAAKAKGTSHLSMTMGSTGTVNADLDYSGSSPKMTMTMTASGESVKAVYVDKVMYLNSPSFAEMTGGKQWVKIDPQGDDMISKMMGPMLSQMEAAMADPGEQLKVVEGAKATVAKVERGVTTYRVRLTKEQILAMAKKQGVAPPGTTDEELLKQVPETASYDLAVTDDYLPSSATVDLLEAGQRLVMTYSKWGEPVTVTVPPASEVGTFEMPTS